MLLRCYEHLSLWIHQLFVLSFFVSLLFSANLHKRSNWLVALQAKKYFTKQKRVNRSVTKLRNILTEKNGEKKENTQRKIKHIERKECSFVIEVIFPQFFVNTFAFLFFSFFSFAVLFRFFLRVVPSIRPLHSIFTQSAFYQCKRFLH